MNEIFSIINGEFIVKSEATILISDLSVQRGYGIFDFFRTVKGQPVFLDDHLDRLFYSARKMNVDKGLNRSKIKELIHQLMAKNNIPESGIRITITGGYSDDGYTLERPNILITQSPFNFDPDKFKKGTRLMTYEHQRQLPSVKTIDYMMAIHLQSLIRSKNADDVLYYHKDEISECPRSNFFMVTENDEVITPAKNVLWGITRKKILGFMDIKLKEGTINLEDLRTAKEAFVTSSTKNVLPVLSIDGAEIGKGHPGRITTEIYRRICKEKEGFDPLK